jgi:predicted nucleic acid-binding protein
MIVLDPSAVATLLDPRLSNHGRARRALERFRLPTVVPAATLDRITHVATDAAGRRAARSFLHGVIEGETLLDCGDLDLPRILELLVRYEAPPIDVAAAAVIACAERHGGRVLSFDERLRPIALDGLIELLG